VSLDCGKNYLDLLIKVMQIISCSLKLFLKVEILVITSALLIVVPILLIKLLSTELHTIIILYASNAKQPTRAKIIGVPTLNRLYRHALVLADIKCIFS